MSLFAEALIYSREITEITDVITFGLSDEGTIKCIPHSGSVMVTNNTDVYVEFEYDGFANAKEEKDDVLLDFQTPPSGEFRAVLLPGEHFTFASDSGGALSPTIKNEYVMINNLSFRVYRDKALTELISLYKINLRYQCEGEKWFSIMLAGDLLTNRHKIDK